MARQAATRSFNRRPAQAKQQRRKAAEEAANSLVRVPLPVITENDLLAFQTSHFGDDTKPAAWIIDAEIAVEYDPAWEDDGLGWYDDGVKRLLTDEQIAMFKHSEIEALVRQGKMAREEIAELDFAQEAAAPVRYADVPVSEASDLKLETRDPSSVNDQQLLAEDKPDIEEEFYRNRPESNRSNGVASTDSSKRKRKRREDVPYNERHKRNWEDYIEETDPTQGSMTHRRIAREMDEIEHESIDLEY